ncbi:MAG: hypothetical protein JSW39_26070 [Desulfobacterales bacterium]|nr:MAG: hypothetical protein JSW39_26070 [Desulfobacterales bacterium]
MMRTAEVVVVFEEPLQNAALEVTRIYKVLKAELEKTLGWELNIRPEIVLVKERETFLRMARRPYFVALAVPAQNLVVIDYSKMNVHPFTLSTTLKHELCHLLLHHHIGGESLPRWLDEGISQWLSDGVAEIIRGRSRSALQAAILSGQHLDVQKMSRRFPDDQRSLELAYEQSKSLVEYIRREYGQAGLLNILAGLKDGVGLDGAIRNSLSTSLAELEAEWLNHLKKRTTWFSYLATNLYAILFFLAALMTIVAFIRRLNRKRNYEDEEDDGPC